MKKTVRIQCLPCLHCGKDGVIEVEMTDEQLDDFTHGSHNIQRIFPELSAEVREMLLTGTHPDCWNDMWSDFSEEEDDEKF